MKANSTCRSVKTGGVGGWTPNRIKQHSLQSNGISLQGDDDIEESYHMSIAVLVLA